MDRTVHKGLSSIFLIFFFFISCTRAFLLPLRFSTSSPSRVPSSTSSRPLSSLTLDSLPLPSSTRCSTSISRRRHILFDFRTFATPREDSTPSNAITSLLVRLGYQPEENDADPRSLRERLQDFGLAGVASYIASEVLFWFISLPVGIVAFHQSTGEWLDLSTSDGQAKVAAFSAGFLTFARVALPLRAGVAFALAPALNKYVIRPLVARGVLEDKE
ncbi:hypothetical protein NGA_0210500 [Nannochloropsis gaditana CCMP526]|uniref:Uncharacterized protein n=1 Tax=Nannochloropsis gaditana TaxID=72520 RepID=W7T0Q7_9STRA|nr:hypothetical protein NGA_0210500 [Nannochloropsis gaditana CCMP526]EKU21906.1 hypothetical protein NGA_0210500 [Nannochloropsis gaditana CCMP526]EWM20675.1 hypothetical protein Naga_100420g5 [Nannochloropsis gaditana]|eukprot:XP_005854453.1 hypothetical protein NGA_0210500 [Nannochloropsis gaditana CCMP526]